MEHEPLEQYKLKLKKLELEANPKFKKITCPSCESEVPAADLNINDKIGKCTNCNAVFPFDEEILALKNSRRVQQEIIRPEGIDIFKFKEELDITLPQSYSIWEGLIFMFVIIFGGLTILISLKNLYFIFPSIGFILITLWLTYRAIIHSKNKTVITIDEHNLTIAHQSKTFAKDKSYPVSEIDQIYVKKMMTNTGLPGVCMIVNGIEGQKHIELINHTGTLTKAKFIEQEIERHLGITDRAVPEEN